MNAMMRSDAALIIIIIFSLICKRSGNIAVQSASSRCFSKTGFDLTRWSDDAVKVSASMVPEQSRSVLLEGGTETSYTGRFLSGERYNIKTEGVYICAIGGLPLFRSEHKFVSGTGWPSFYDVFDQQHIEEVISPELKGYTEIRCARTGCHIGHAFPDKPTPQLERYLEQRDIKYDRFCFVRYCVNAAALRFVPLEELHTLK